MLLRAGGYEVVAEAADGAAAMTAAARLHPDAALVDVQLPDTDGLALAKRLVESDRRLRVVLTSTDATLMPALAFAGSGALAFVPKQELAVTDLRPWFGGSAR